MKTTERLPSIVVFTGNMRRPSHARALGDYLALRLQETLPVALTFHDIVDAGPGLAAGFDRDDLGASARAVIEDIEAADGLIAVTPTYKGSYTGLFKHVIDFLDPLALVDRPVLIGATGGGYRHALMVEHQLRPLFGFFSALTVPTAVYASDTEFEDGRPVAAALIERAEQAIAQMAVLLSARRGRLTPAQLRAHAAANIAGDYGQDP